MLVRAAGRSTQRENVLRLTGESLVGASSRDDDVHALLRDTAALPADICAPITLVPANPLLGTPAISSYIDPLLAGLTDLQCASLDAAIDDPDVDSVVAVYVPPLNVSGEDVANVLAIDFVSGDTTELAALGVKRLDLVIASHPHADHVVAGVLAEGRTVADAIERPRMHRVGEAVMVEPDFEDEGAQALADAGYEVRRFATRHHFFGGVSGIGRETLAADSRRDGASRVRLGRRDPGRLRPARH